MGGSVKTKRLMNNAGIVHTNTHMHLHSPHKKYIKGSLCVFECTCVTQRDKESLCEGSIAGSTLSPKGQRDVFDCVTMDIKGVWREGGRKRERGDSSLNINDSHTVQGKVSLCPLSNISVISQQRLASPPQAWNCGIVTKRNFLLCVLKLFFYTEGSI